MSDLTVRFKVNFRKGNPQKKATEAVQEAPQGPNRPKAKPPIKPGVTRIARMLALAYYVERQVEAGKIRDYAAAARRLGISRARMTQVMNLLNLPVQTQEAILSGEKMSERGLRQYQSGTKISHRI